MATLDLNLLPIHRLNNQESASLPGLLAVSPPRRSARGRERDNLIAYLVLAGNATFSTAEFMQITSNAAGEFYQSAGSLTTAMKNAANSINTALLERNLSTTGRGQYALGALALAAIRDNQCTVLLSGSVHAFSITMNETKHIFDLALSGKGLGVNQSIGLYYSQIELKTNDRLLFCSKLPDGWEQALNDHSNIALEAMRRKLLVASGDLNAVLIQAMDGKGNITILKPEITITPHPKPEIVAAIQASIAPQPVPAPTPEPKIAESAPQPQVDEEPSANEKMVEELANLAAHLVQPSAYAIPPQPPEEELIPPASQPSPIMETPITRSFPPSIPRAKPAEVAPQIEITPEPKIEPKPEPAPASTAAPEEGFTYGEAPPPTVHAEATRQIAKTIVGGIQTGRRVNERIGGFFQKFLPRLLPGSESNETFVVPTYAMVFISIIIPVLVVTIASVVYLRFGQSVQYEEYYSLALNSRIKAISAGTPTAQRDAWNEVLANVDKAEKYRVEPESQALRAEAESKLDQLMNITRLDFVRAFPAPLGSSQITRLAASESDLYMLDAVRGNILHAAFTGRSLEMDNTFDCKPGSYGGYQVNTLVDIVALPKGNMLNSTVMGIDSSGTLLYCAPGQVPQAFPLPAVPTKWGRITAIVLDVNWLYVLDAPSHAIWLYRNENGAFTKTPLFFFGEQIPPIEDAIDMTASNDDIYLLHADGHITSCSFSSNPDVQTRCTDPAPFVDRIPAHEGLDIFHQAHFTQMVFTAPPDQSVLLLDADGQSVFRFTPRTLELQNQFRSRSRDANPFQPGAISAMTVSPNHMLYAAIDNQIYFAINLP